MVKVTAADSSQYCIDSTEVTQAQYAEFVAAVTPDTFGQDAECAGNASFDWATSGPGVFPCTAATIDPSTQPDYPMSCIDWCDAAAYCSWAGKRLCGQIGGGPNPYSNYAVATSSEWLNACSDGGAFTYPDGGTSAEACESPTPRVVASAAACEGAFPGVFDMGGNVWEFENSCDTTNGYCRLRGGSFGQVNDGNPLRCDVAPSVDRDHVEANVGFRCCAEAL